LQQRGRWLAAALALPLFWAAPLGAMAAPAQQGGHGSFVSDVARHLGVPEQKLKDAITQARLDRVRTLLRQGRITGAQAQEMERAIRTGGTRMPLWHRQGRAFGRAMVTGAAAYVGLAPAVFVQRLHGGESPAAIAKAQGKSPEGLEQSLLAGAKQHLTDEVQRGHLTQSQADALVAELAGRVHRFVQSDRSAPPV